MRRLSNTLVTGTQCARRWVDLDAGIRPGKVEQYVDQWDTTCEVVGACGWWNAAWDG